MEGPDIGKPLIAYGRKANGETVMRLLRKTGPSGQTSMVDDRKTWLPWAALVKRSVARFARGSIAAQNLRILLPEEQAREHARTAPIARQWKERAKQRRSA
jgi:hypothetical protein